MRQSGNFVTYISTKSRTKDNIRYKKSTKKEESKQYSVKKIHFKASLQTALLMKFDKLFNEEKNSSKIQKV